MTLPSAEERRKRAETIYGAYAAGALSVNAARRELEALELPYHHEGVL